MDTGTEFRVRRGLTSPPDAGLHPATGLLQHQAHKESPVTKRKGTPNNAKQLDNAAVCMAETSPRASCAEKPRTLFCRVFCCANANPIIGKDGKECRQSCADKLLTAHRCAGNGGNPKEFGKTGDTFYHNSYSHIMFADDDAPAAGNYTYMSIKGENKKCIVCRPDISTFDENNKLDTLYDYKFKDDSWRGGQKENYGKLVHGEEDRVVELNDTTCPCNNQKKNTISSAEKEKVKKDMRNIFPEFYGIDSKKKK